MKNWFIKNWKNKYFLTTLFFVFYGMFLDDLDIFTIVKQNIKLSELKKERVITEKQLMETKSTLANLDTIHGIEKFAREKKYFKKDNEEIFVITYE